jgi:rhamnosyl/mannosyltransferase
MAAGRPVVSTELGTGTSWVNQNGRTGLVVAAGDPDALAGALDTLLRDPERRRWLGENGRQRVLDHFHIEQMIDRTIAIYCEAVDGGPAPRPPSRPDP